MDCLRVDLSGLKSQSLETRGRSQNLANHLEKACSIDEKLLGWCWEACRWHVKREASLGFKHHRYHTFLFWRSYEVSSKWVRRAKRLLLGRV